MLFPVRWQLRLIVLELKCDVGLWEHMSKFGAEVCDCPHDIRSEVFTNMCLVNINLSIMDPDFLK